jgi:hypothetical protein
MDQQRATAPRPLPGPAAQAVGATLGIVRRLFEAPSFPAIPRGEGYETELGWAVVAAQLKTRVYAALLEAGVAACGRWTFEHWEAAALMWLGPLFSWQSRTLREGGKWPFLVGEVLGILDESERTRYESLVFRAFHVRRRFDPQTPLGDAASMEYLLVPDFASISAETEPWEWHGTVDPVRAIEVADEESAPGNGITLRRAVRMFVALSGALTRTTRGSENHRQIERARYEWRTRLPSLTASRAENFVTLWPVLVGEALSSVVLQERAEKYRHVPELFLVRTLITEIEGKPAERMDFIDPHFRPPEDLLFEDRMDPQQKKPASPETLGGLTFLLEQASLPERVEAVSRELGAAVASQLDGGSHTLVDALAATAFAVGGSRDAAREHFERFLGKLENQGFPSLAEQEAFAQALGDALSKFGLRLRCQRCGAPSTLVVIPRSDNRGTFAFRHSVGRRTNHGRSKKAPDGALLPKLEVYTG